MTLLTWNHANTIGVRAMDDQHGILMDALNDVRLILLRGGGRERVDEGLTRLIGLTRMHFSSEEQLLEQHGFPGFHEHRDAHRRLLTQLESVVQRAVSRDELRTRTLLLFLRDWYLSHVETLDRVYGSWLNDQGIV